MHGKSSLFQQGSHLNYLSCSHAQRLSKTRVLLAGRVYGVMCLSEPRKYPIFYTAGLRSTTWSIPWNPMAPSSVIQRQCFGNGHRTHTAHLDIPEFQAPRRAFVDINVIFFPFFFLLPVLFGAALALLFTIDVASS